MSKSKASPIAADRLKSRAKSEARLRVVNGIGDIYAAASGNRLWIKIGFSTRLADRMRDLHYEHPDVGGFRLLGTTRSTFRVEQQIHRTMRSLHGIHINAGKELYPAGPAVLAIVERLIAEPTLEPIDLDSVLELRRWCHAQAKLEPNVIAFRKAHARKIEEMEQAHARWYAKLRARVAARVAWVTA